MFGARFRRNYHDRRVLGQVPATHIEIFGTDFSSAVVQRARSARYQQIEANRGLPVTMLVKYFTSAGVEWQLRDDLRRTVRFEQIDLRKHLGCLGIFDLVFCRNVMIYFDAQTRLRLLEQLRCCLPRGGWLLLGGAETSSEIDRWFERRTIANATIYETK